MLHDNDLEQIVLGAIILESESIIKVNDILHSTDFYSKDHQNIFKICAELYTKQEPIDLITVSSQIRKYKLSIKIPYLNFLTGRVNSSANLSHHAFLLKQLSIKRRLLSITEQIKTNVTEDPDIFETLDNAQSDILKITQDNSKGQVFKLHQQYAEVINEIFDMMNHKAEGRLTGIDTGFRDLNSLTDGWQDTTLTIIAARPGMGKTAFALQLALQAARTGKKVLLFSLEMNTNQLVKRLLANITGISLGKILTGRLNAQEAEMLTAATAEIEQLEISIDDNSGISVNQFMSRCRQQDYEQKGIDLIIVDYLQLMREPNQKTREQEISRISQELKNTAKRLDCPVIALAQLSRAVEQRADKKPMLSDLRESGSIEQDADIVIFLYRPAYYELNDESGNSLENVCFVLVAKNRQGKLQDIQISFFGDKMQFTN